MKRQLMLSLIAIALCCWTACSDNNDDISTSSEKSEKTDEALTAEEIAEMTFDEFICSVCETEIDEETHRVKSWQLNYGKALDSSQPTVRYCKAESQEAARSIFLGMAAIESHVDSSSVVGILKVDVGSHGTLTYTPGTVGGELAHIDVNIKELPELTKIVLLKSEAWPENVDPYLGIYNGDVFKNGDAYYVCIKDCANGVGYLIGFDTWTYQGNYPSSSHTYKGRTCYDPYWDGAVSSGGTDVIRALHEFLYHGGKRNSESEGIIRMMGNAQNNQGDALVNALYSDIVFFKIGNDRAWCDGYNNKKGTWHKTRCPYTRMLSNGGIVFRKVKYECDEIWDNTCDVFEDGSETSWGKSLVRDHFGGWWKDYTMKWDQFLNPYVIVYRNTDADTYNEFLAKKGLSVPNF